MRAPLGWLGEYVEMDPDVRGREVAAALVRMGLEEEALHGGDIVGPIVVGRVLDLVEEPQKNGKTIRWCHVDVGENGQKLTDGTPQGVVCGARNFAVGDLVVVVLPGAVLPGGFAVGARKTYGHVSAGMICSERELGLGQDHDGILVLGDYLGADAAAGLQPGDDAIALLGLGEEVVEVTVTPDRGYCFSVRGLAREYSHATGATFRDPAVLSSPPANDSGYAVRLADDAPIHGRAGCDRYVARIVRDVDASRPSPPWLARRVAQMGMRSISLAVDVTNYVMLALGQPLHAFDLDALHGPIVVRRARAGETLTTLDGVVRRLDPQDLLITDGGDVPLAIAGVMGGATSEVTAATRHLLIESAHFDAVTVARSSRRHKLITEASKRYERGVDPAMSAAAAQLAVDLLVRYGGGTVHDGVTDVDEREAVRRVVVDTRAPARLVGLPYTRDEVVESLQAIGCEVSDLPDGDPAYVSVLPPTWRPDLWDAHDPDFAEEVARLGGYDRILSVLPPAPPGRGLTHDQRVRRIVANTLADTGWVEVLTYPFASTASADQLGLPADDPRRTAVRIANPLSEEAPLMRTSVLSTLVDALRRNVARGHKDVAVFEIGLVTRPEAAAPKAPVPSIGALPGDDVLADIDAAVPPQPRRVAMVMCGQAEPSGWWGPGRAAEWSDAVGAARSVATALGVSLVATADDHAPWHPGRCARLTLSDGALVGHAGELHPKALVALGLPARTVAAELDLGTLVVASDRRQTASPLSTYPVALSDVALVVREDVPAGAVDAALRGGAGDLLERLRLFDVYRGDQVSDGHKSLAYRLEFRAPDRTLTTEEVSRLRDDAVAAAASATGAVQR